MVSKSKPQRYEKSYLLNSVELRKDTSLLRDRDNAEPPSTLHMMSNGNNSNSRAMTPGAQQGLIIQRIKSAQVANQLERNRQVQSQMGANGNYVD